METPQPASVGGDEKSHNDKRVKSPNVDKLMQKGAYRKKQGVVKNEKQMKFYYDDSKRELHSDLVDFYLKDRFNIVLGNKKQKENQRPATPDSLNSSLSDDRMGISAASK